MENTNYAIGVCDFESAFIARLLQTLKEAPVDPLSVAGSVSIGCIDTVWVNPITDSPTVESSNFVEKITNKINNESGLALVNLPAQNITAILDRKRFSGKLSCFGYGSPQGDNHPVRLSLLEQIIAAGRFEIPESLTARLNTVLEFLLNPAPTMATGKDESVSAEKLQLLSNAIRKYAYLSLTPVPENSSGESTLDQLINDLLPQDETALYSSAGCVGCLLEKAKEEKKELVSKISKGGSHLLRYLHSGRIRRLSGESYTDETILMEVPFDDHWFACEAGLEFARKSISCDDFIAHHRPDILILATRKTNSGTASSRSINSVFYDYTGNNPLISSLTDSLPETVGVKHCLLPRSRLSCIGGYSSAAGLSGFVDAVLSETLRHQRPVVAFRTQFFRAFRLPADYEAEASASLNNAGKSLQQLKTSLTHLAGKSNSQFKILRVHDEDHSYWLRHIPSLLALKQSGAAADPDAQSGIVSCEWTPDNLEISIEHGKTLEEGWFSKKIQHTVKAVRIHFFYLDTIMLEWEVDITDKENWYEAGQSRLKYYQFKPPLNDDENFGSENNPPFWLQVLTHADNNTISVGGCLDQLHIMRFANSGFKAHDTLEPAAFWSTSLHPGEYGQGIVSHDQTFQRGFEATPTPEIASGVVAQLFKALIEACRPLPQGLAPYHSLLNHLQCIGDDRLAHLSSMIISGPMPASDDGMEFTTHLCSRLRMADPAGQGAHYDPGWERDESPRHVYRRWWHAGSLYTSTDQGFAYVGSGEFAYRQVHAKHMHRYYYPMFLLVQFYAGIVQGFQAQVAAATQNMSTKPVKLTRHYVELLPKFHKFRNQLFFERLSSQLQANELFDLMRSTSRGIAEYTSLEEQIERTQSYWDDYKERDAENRLRTLTAVALPPAVMLGFQGLFDIKIWSVLKATGCKISSVAGSATGQQCESLASDFPRWLSDQWLWAIMSLIALLVCRIGGLPADIGAHLHRRWQQLLLQGMYWVPILLLTVIAASPWF